VFDYGDGHYAELPPANGDEMVTAAMTPAQGSGASRWPARRDPFSTFRPGFDLRTYRGQPWSALSTVESTRQPHDQRTSSYSRAPRPRTSATTTARDRTR
jgi:hypothetical protein